MLRFELKNYSLVGQPIILQKPCLFFFIKNHKPKEPNESKEWRLISSLVNIQFKGKACSLRGWSI